MCLPKRDKNIYLYFLLNRKSNSVTLNFPLEKQFWAVKSVSQGENVSLTEYQNSVMKGVSTLFLSIFHSNYQWKIHDYSRLWHKILSKNQCMNYYSCILLVQFSLLQTIFVPIVFLRDIGQKIKIPGRSAFEYKKRAATNGTLFLCWSESLA